MEKMIPKQDLAEVLEDYGDLYYYVTTSQRAYRHVCKRAKSAFFYLLRMVMFLAGGIICINLATTNPLFRKDPGLQGIPMIAGAVLIVLFVCGFFTFESRVGGKRSIRIGILFNIENLVVYMLELAKLKQIIGAEKSVFLMMLCIDLKSEDKLIERYLYTYGMGYELNQSICEYNQKYKDCRDYVNFDQHWYIAETLYKYVQSGRVSTGAEALRYYDLQQHRKKLEYEVERQNDINQAIVDAERERIEAIKENTKTAQNKTRAANEYADAVRELTKTVNDRGVISNDDAKNLEDALDRSSKNLEG